MKRSLALTSHSLAAFLLVTTASSAFAQLTPETVPGASRPEFQERRYQIEQRPELGGTPLITLPDQGGRTATQGTKFTLKDIQIEDAKAIPASELERFYKDKRNTQITLGELNQIAANITTEYRNRGYILTRAIVPPQRIRGGIAKIRIVEGFVSDVVIQGEVDKDSVIYDYAAKIRAAKPLDAATLERYLLLMEDLPGVEARAVLQPSPSTPGASQVVVNITRKRVEASATLDNRGSRFIGPVQAGANLHVNNLLNREDQTQIRYANSMFDYEELHFGELRHEHQLGSEGTKLLVAASHVSTAPGHTLEPLEVEGDSDSISLGVTHPLLRSRQSNLFINSDLSVRHVDVEALGVNLYEDKLRVFSVGAAYDFLDSWSAINRFDVNLDQGLDWWTDTGQNDASRANGKNSFTKFSGKATRLQPIDGPWSAYGAVSGQYSFDPLLAAEEFALGGSEFGSAYDSAEITGDSGLAGRLELQYNAASGWDFFEQYQLYGFYDLGAVWNRSILNGSEDYRTSLSSTGVGARFNVIESLTGGVELSVPLTRKVAAYGDDGSAPRVFFNLYYRY